MIDKAKLENMYLSQKMSMREISEKLNIPEFKIRKMIISYGIRIRTKSENTTIVFEKKLGFTPNLSKEEAEDMYFKKRMSLTDIVKETKIPYNRLRNIFKELGIEIRTRADGLRYVRHKLGQANKGKKRVFTEEHKRNLRLGIIKKWERSANGITQKRDGYIEYTRGVNKYRGVHVVKMEEKIGRKLLPGEVVHHINGIKNDNRMENLQLMTNVEHSRLHALENVGNRKRNKEGRFICQ
jgi:hypothetical protein